MRMTITAILAFVVVVCVFNQGFEGVFGVSAYVVIGLLSASLAFAIWTKPIRFLFGRPEGQQEVTRFLRRPLT